MSISLVDANWVMRRNYYAIKSARYPDYISIISSFLSSVCNICEENSSYNAYLIWDRSPYFKSNTLSLKSSRYYANESDVVEIPANASDEVRAELEAKNNWIREQAKMESEFRHAKNFLLKCSRFFGLPSIAYVGYEADDLAYIIANELGIKTDIKFLTKDSDWYYLMGPHTEFTRLTKNREYHRYDENGSKIPLLIQGILKSLLSDNHNDIELVNIGIKYDEALKIYENSEWNEKNWMFAANQSQEVVSNFLNRAKALDPRTFLTEEIKSNLMDQLNVNIPEVTFNSLKDFCKKSNIRCNFSKILSLYSKRRKNLNLMEETIIKFPEI